MTQTELTSTYIALTSQNDIAAHKEIEEHVINNMSSLDAENLSFLLYNIAKERVGDRYLMDRLLQSIEMQSESPDMILTSTRIQLMISLNMVGASRDKRGNPSKAFANIGTSLTTLADSFTKEELYLLQDLLQRDNRPTGSSVNNSSLSKLLEQVDS
jgi:hypothetical protein